MSSAVIFSGTKVKAQKDTINLNGGPDIISSTTNPTSVAVSANAGSLLLNTSSGLLYRKNDNGSTTNWSELAPTSFTAPSGSITAYAGSASPSGWLLCDGSAVSRATYSTLYSALGGASSPWGLGDGSTTFNVPDLRGNFLRGAGTQTRYTFTITSSSVTQGAVYSNNSQNFRVIATISSSTTLVTIGSGAPLSSGTLTLVSGTGPATISFSANTSTSYTGTLGAGQSDQMQGHRHGIALKNNNNAVGNNIQLATSGNTFVFSSDGTLGNVTTGGTVNGDGNSKDPASDGTNGTPRTGLENRPVNISINYIIKT